MLKQEIFDDNLADPMEANELLLWMSARRNGSWFQFRSAVDELGLSVGHTTNSAFPVHQQLRLNLERHAHVEFEDEDGENAWRVAPAVLAGTQASNQFVGILCGARSTALLTDVRAAAAHVRCETSQFTNCPDVIRIISPDEDSLASIAVAAGISYQADCTANLLRFLAHIDSVAVGAVTEMPFGKDVSVDLFVTDPKRLYWRRISHHEARQLRDGLFRCTRWRVPSHYLKKSGQVFTTSGQTGKFFVLSQKRRRVVRYDVPGRQLIVPAICRPPALVERALILCSGLPPAETLSSTRSGAQVLFLAYQNVNPAIAGLVSELLRQPLQ